MNIAFAHFPHTGAGAASWRIWRLVDTFYDLDHETSIATMRPGMFTNALDIRQHRKLSTLAWLPSFTGHFLIWQMMQFLGEAAASQYKWSTVNRRGIRPPYQG